jgi:hypothetical protein
VSRGRYMRTMVQLTTSKEQKSCGLNRHNHMIQIHKHRGMKID